MKFILDRMLGKMRIWLRLYGFDTLYVGELNVEGDEDRFLLEYFSDRILLTRDEELYTRAVKQNRKVIFISSNGVRDQLGELKDMLNLNFAPVMDRCSLCNTLLRKPTGEETDRALKKDKLPDSVKKYTLYYCPNCVKLYWTGKHWVNISDFTSRLNSDQFF
jgi:hypothetical protein